MQKAPGTPRIDFEASFAQRSSAPEVHLSSGGAKIVVIERKLSNSLAELLVQKFDARHQEIPQENISNNFIYPGAQGAVPLSVRAGSQTFAPSLSIMCTRLRFYCTELGDLSARKFV